MEGMDPVRRERVRHLGEIVADAIPDELLTHASEDQWARFVKTLMFSTLQDVVIDCADLLPDDD